jgi:hypothetical protein
MGRLLSGATGLGEGGVGGVGWAGMGSEPPVLEYARGERVGGGDRYRLWFLLAGLPALVGLCVPIVPISSRNPVVGNLLGSLSELAGEIARRIAGGDFSGQTFLLIALSTGLVAPLSAMVWRIVRLGSREPGRSVRIVGLSLCGIHLAGVLMLSGSLLFARGSAGRMDIGAMMGVGLVVCVGLVLWSRTRLDLGAWVLVVLAGVEMVVWGFGGLVMLCGRVNFTGELLLGIIFVMTGLVRGFECGHLLRSRWVVGQRG